MMAGEIIVGALVILCIVLSKHFWNLADREASTIGDMLLKIFTAGVFIIGAITGAAILILGMLG